MISTVLISFSDEDIYKKWDDAHRKLLTELNSEGKIFGTAIPANMTSAEVVGDKLVKIFKQHIERELKQPSQRRSK